MCLSASEFADFRFRKLREQDISHNVNGCESENSSDISSDDSEGVTPVPIPNTEVKPFSADGTWLEATWESRTSLVNDLNVLG